MSSSPRFSPYGQMVLATVLFAFMGVCVKLASAHFGTAAVVSMRGLVGAIMMALIAWHADTPLRTRVPMLHVKRGLAGVLALSLWFYCIGHLPLATAVTLNYMSSVWMAVYLLIGQGLFGGQRVDRRLVMAIAIGFLGVGLVLHPTLSREQLFAGVLGIGSGMLAAAAYVQVTALGRAGEPEVRVVFYFSLMGTLLGALTWLIPGQDNHTALAAIPWWAWTALIGVGAFATIAQLLMTRAYARGRMLVNASLQYLGIVHASVLGMLIFGERLSWDGMLGMALIVGAGIVSTRLKSASGQAARHEDSRQ
ncbi:MAG: DMT family transporter [Aquabacterium sp.]